MLVSVPAAASVTSRYSPSDVKVASWGERKGGNAAPRRKPAPNIVTVPDPGLTTATGPPGAAETVLGSGATGMRRTTRPPGSDTTTSSFLSSAVTSATWVPGRCGVTVVGRADALLGGVVDARVGASEGSVPGLAAPVQDALSSSHPATTSVATDLTTGVRPSGRAASPTL